MPSQTSLVSFSRRVHCAVAPASASRRGWSSASVAVVVILNFSFEAALWASQKRCMTDVIHGLRLQYWVRHSFTKAIRCHSFAYTTKKHYCNIPLFSDTRPWNTLYKYVPPCGARKICLNSVHHCPGRNFPIGGKGPEEYKSFVTLVKIWDINPCKLFGHANK